MTIPYNIFILAWCILGVCLLGFYNFKDMANGTFSFNRHLLTEVIWFLIFLLYCIAYLKNRLRTKVAGESAES